MFLVFFFRAAICFSFSFFSWAPVDSNSFSLKRTQDQRAPKTGRK